MENIQLYWAYGSNLNVAQMARRCPAAVKFAPLTIKDHVLLFRGVADVAWKRGTYCPGGLWWISDECERSLDIYEGVSSGLYIKRYLKLRVRGVERKALVYQMKNRRGVMPPSEYDLGSIEKGYEDFGLDLAYLDAALAHSWDRKHKTPELRKRWRRHGRPELARCEA